MINLKRFVIAIVGLIVTTSLYLEGEYTRMAISLIFRGLLYYEFTIKKK